LFAVMVFAVTFSHQRSTLSSSVKISDA